MEVLLSATVGLTVAVAVAALALALTANRRLRRLQQQIEPIIGPMGPVDDLPAPGTPLPEFLAEATDGSPVSNADLAGPDGLVLFVTGSCPTCFDAVAALRGLPSGAEPRPIVVVIGQPDEVAGLVSDLEPLARVVVEPAHNGLPAQFGVRGFPAALVVGNGVVRAASHWLDQIELGVRA